MLNWLNSPCIIILSTKNPSEVKMCIKEESVLQGIEWTLDALLKVLVHNWTSDSCTYFNIHPTFKLDVNSRNVRLVSYWWGGQ